jgi:hypothetical protein
VPKCQSVLHGQVNICTSYHKERDGLLKGYVEVPAYRRQSDRHACSIRNLRKYETSIVYIASYMTHTFTTMAEEHAAIKQIDLAIVGVGVGFFSSSVIVPISGESAS